MDALNVYTVMHVKDVITQYTAIIALTVNGLILVLIATTAITVLDVLINHINSI